MAEIGIDVERMAQKVADAINNAQAGTIIDQSEEQVRDAHAEFRQKTYRKILDLQEESQQVLLLATVSGWLLWSGKRIQVVS